MDPTRDNPIIRFTAFWWSIGTFLVFALLLAVIWWFNRQPAASLEDVVARVRYETKAKFAQAQAASLPQALIDAAIPAVAEKLAASKPAAVEKPEQVVPGTPTAEKAAPVPATPPTPPPTTPPTTPPVQPPEPPPAADPSADAEEIEIDPVVMQRGKLEFRVCGTCHGRNLSGNRVAGSAEVLIRIQLRGIQGPYSTLARTYQVIPGRTDPSHNADEYSFYPGMPSFAYRSDQQIAAVLTYVRNSFGNKAPAVQPSEVAALRGEVGKPQLTPQELTQP